MQVHMFWAYGPFSQLETLCARSFVAQGYPLQIWNYQGLDNSPEGASLRDAREIWSENRLFTYKNGSYAAFADLFRYALLNREGGLYVDADIIAVKGPSFVPKEPFLVTERVSIRGSRIIRPIKERFSQPKTRINNCVIHKPHPAQGDIIDMAEQFAERYPLDLLEWGDAGPKLLSMLHEHYPQLSYQAMPPEFANPVNWWSCPAQLLSLGKAIPEDTVFLHCYNETWRRSGIDKNANFPAGSIVSNLSKRFSAVASPLKSTPSV